MTEAEFQQLRDNFLSTFTPDEGQIVLRYLAQFCRINAAEFVADPRLETYLAGRRSVYCEIQNIMKGKEA